MPWLVEWEPADDPQAWLRQLADWLDEEMYTGGLGPAYAHVHGDDQVRLVVDGYGFRQADEAEHQRLRRAVGPHGWHAARSKRHIRKQYAAEWGLDQVEHQIQEESLADLVDVDELAWTLTSPEKVSVHVEASPQTGASGALEFILAAYSGLDGEPVGRRRITRSI